MQVDDPIPPVLGITYVPALPPEGLLAAAAAADESGLEEFWLWEDCFFHGGIATLAACLGATRRVRVGLGLMPVGFRNPASVAMEVATLNRLFPGRVLAGIGHGGQHWMEKIGARPASPMTLLEEYHDALRELLDGESVTREGAYVALRDVRLDWPPLERTPILVGGEGPRSIRLAARIGDGNLLTAALGREEIAAACEAIRDERQRVGREGPHDICVILIVTTGAGAEGRLETEAERWRKAGVPGVGVAGDADAVAAEIVALARLGVTRVAVQPTVDEPDLSGLIDFLGSEVAPRVVAAVKA